METSSIEILSPMAQSWEKTNDINPSFLFFFFYPSFVGTDYYCQCVAERDRIRSPLESTQQIVSTSNDDGVGTIISVLLFVAFAALSILTIGIIYLGVTDFLQKRETEKLKKEDESKKKGGKKRKVRVRSGPRGFGQKIDEVDEFDD
ncbi:TRANSMEMBRANE PROTEIN [Salix koriyanagi]|uniref:TRANSMEMBRANE PROTEIN n=1 Tax=Salix koriyanagi TaxID=2511006 RepID=A0A9Q1ANH3_9ROSI|nr:TRANSMEMBRANE PROTEIN [Salix koriyanagi]